MQLLFKYVLDNGYQMGEYLSGGSVCRADCWSKINLLLIKKSRVTAQKQDEKNTSRIHRIQY